MIVISPSTINKDDHKIIKHSLTIQCLTCDRTTVISCVVKTQTLLVPNCIYCGYVPQSSEFDITNVSLWDTFSAYNPLSTSAVADAESRKSSVLNWLYEGTHYSKSFLSEYIQIPVHLDEHINLIEDVCILMYSLLRSRNISDRYVSIVSFCKMRGSRPSFTTMLIYVASEIFGNMKDKKLDQIYKGLHKHVLSEVEKETTYELQDEEYDNIFAELRSYTSVYERIKETALYKKVYKFGLYVLSSGLLSHSKISFDSLGYSKFEQAAIERTHKPGMDMIHCMVDTVLFVCDRGTQYFHTQDPEVLMSSGGSHEKWMSRAQRLIRESKFLSNPEPHGINRFTFTSELKDTIERGIALTKYSVGLERTEKLILQKTVNELQLIQANEITKKDARAPRKEPFSIMIHGPSSIAKTQLVQIMFMHYGKAFKLPVSPEFMYTRVAVDPFWSGQNSSQWCAVMDDVAFLKPNGQLDPTLSETIMVGNQTPFCPPQAELEDKGRTPLKIDLLLGTTNTLNLNLHDYFSCPFAVARRWKFYVTATVKPEYSKHNLMVDSTLIPPTPEGEYMNIWNFVVSVVVPAKDTIDDKMRAKYHIIEKFSDIYDLLQFLTTAAKAHEVAQLKSLSAMENSRGVDICDQCYRPVRKCTCIETEISQFANLVDDPVPVVPVVRPAPSRPVYIPTWEKFQRELYEPEWHPEIPCQKCGGLGCDHPEKSDMIKYNRDRASQYRRRMYEYYKIDVPPPRDDWHDPNWHQGFLPQADESYLDRVKQWIPTFHDEPLIPLSEEPIMPQPQSRVSLMRYWFFSRIIAQDVIESDMEEVVKIYFHIYRSFFYPLLVSLFFYNFGLFMIIPLGICIYILVKHVWVITSIYFQYIYGDFWKIKLAYRIFGQDSSAYVFVFKVARNRIQRFITPKHLMQLSLLMGSLLACSKLRNFFQSEKHSPQADVASFSDGTPPVPHPIEKPVFYYHDPYVFTDVDISNQSKNCQPGVLENKIRRNTARFQFLWEGNEGKCNSTSALNVKGHIWMFNQHVIKGTGNGTLNVVLDPLTQNLSRNVRNITIRKTDIHCFGTDLAFISLRALPPGPSLVEYFAKKDRIPGRFDGMYHLISNIGERSTLPIKDLRKGVCPYFNVPAYLGYVSTPTKSGDCGSPCVMYAGANRKIILGIHATGNQSTGVSIMPVSQHDLEMVLTTFTPQVESGTIKIDEPGYERELTDVHPKSALRFIPQGTAHVMGSFKGFRPQHKSKVRPTFIRDLVVMDGYKDNHGAPDMTWKPWHIGLSSMTQPNFSVASGDIAKCSNAFADDIIRKMAKDLHELKPYDLNTALNGVDGVTYVDRINVRTSAGNPFKKSKINFITLDDDNKVVEIDDVIANRVKEIENLYRQGKRAHPQFCEHLKDEPVSDKKRRIGKTRLFSGAEFAWSLVVRKNLLPHIRLIQNNPHLFESMPGVVAQSEEWQQLYNALKEKGLDRIIAGDYAFFDKNMIAELVLACFDFLIKLSEAGGASPEELMTLRCIGEDTAFAILDFNGDLIELQGNPSGHPLTVIINCIANCIYMRYAYMVVTGKDPSNFKNDVSLFTYGDDNIMSVSADCPEFNHTSIAKALADIGVVYTMADKEAESKPYIDIGEASFLKRSFRFDADIGAVVAPLDHTSIEKMLTSFVDGGNISVEAHSICVIETALREYFYYGKEKFEERKAYFKDLVERAGLQMYVRDSTFPEYDLLVHEFWMRTGNVKKAQEFAPTISC